jgi:hypothetical protein
MQPIIIWRQLVPFLTKFRVDLSDEDNPLWTSLKIRRIPTLIAYHNGEELRRREATYMVGLRKADFAEVDSVMKD